MVLFVLACCASAPAEILNIRQAPYSAVGDGETDDRPALKRVIEAAQAGDVVLIPAGEYRMVLDGGPLVIPAGVTLWGQGGKTTLSLTSNGGDSKHREFLRPSDDVTLVGLTIRRDEGFPTILLPIGSCQRVTLRDCRIDGQKSKYGAYCHAMQVGSGTVKDLTFRGVEIVDCDYGLFQTNSAKGTLDGVLVEHCRFAENRSSDLEFNSPNGTMRNITVRECVFTDNRAKSASGGFAVGFANVTNGRVERCRITNYGSEALHVEDRSADIELVGNTIVAGSTIHRNGVILIINDSRRVTIRDNYIDGRLNPNSPHLILVTAGGDKFPNPSDVSVIDNVLINGPTTRTWYLQDGSGPEPVGNRIIDAPESP